MTDKLKPDEDITDLVRFVRSMIKAGAPDETIASSLAAWNRRTPSARLEAERAVIEAIMASQVYFLKLIVQPMSSGYSDVAHRIEVNIKTALAALTAWEQAHDGKAKENKP